MEARVAFVFSVFIWSTSVCTPAEEQLEKAVNCFSVALYKELVNNRNNLVASPLSVDLLLSLLLVGAGGHTAEELVDALGYKELSIDAMQDAFKTKVASTKTSGANTLSIANSIWLQKSHDFNRTFKRVASDKFFAHVFPVDFERRPRQVTEKINVWAKTETEGLISELLQDELDRATVMALVNVIYFKGQWAKKFDPKLTRRGTFHNHGSIFDVSEVHMMTQQSAFNYKYDAELNAEVLEIPYVGNNMSFVIFLPEIGTKFEDFEQALTCEKFEGGFQSGLLRTTVDVTMPIFELSSYFDLQSSLSQLGVQRIFDVSANLSGIRKNIYVTKCVQNSVFSVSEEGSEGAAGSAIVAGKRTISNFPDFVHFRLDRPFLFLVRHKISNLVLYIGRVTELQNP